MCEDIINKTILLESIEYLIEEDLDKYLEMAPTYKGKKLISEKAWDTLWDKLFGKYEQKEKLSVDESRRYEKETRKFGEIYICDFEI